MAPEETKTTSPTVERLRQAIQASRNRLRERDEGSHTFAEWLQRPEAIRNSEPSSADAPAAPPEALRLRSLTMTITSLPDSDALERIARALGYFPPVAKVTLTSLSEDRASLELLLSEPVSGRDIVAALQRDIGERLLIMETLPDRLRLRVQCEAAAATATSPA